MVFEKLLLKDSLYFNNFYQYFMNKPSYYNDLTEFWSETLPVRSYSLKTLTEN